MSNVRAKSEVHDRVVGSEAGKRVTSHSTFDQKSFN